MRCASKATRQPHSRLDLSAFPPKLGVSRAHHAPLSPQADPLHQLLPGGRTGAAGSGQIKWLSFVTGYVRPTIKHGAVEI